MMSKHDTSETSAPARVADGWQRLGMHPALRSGGRERFEHCRPVGLIGVGTLGHRVGLGLSALPLHQILIDHDDVEGVNVGVQLFDWQDIGKAKAEIIAARLRAIRPDARPRSYVANVKRIGPGVLHGCELIIGAVDSLRDRVWLAQTTTHLNVPYLDLAMDGTGEAMFGAWQDFIRQRAQRAWLADGTTRIGLPFLKSKAARAARY